MNEELLRTLMSDIDPVRDLGNDVLDEFVPFDKLMIRVRDAIEQPRNQSVREHEPTLLRVKMRAGAIAAAVVLVAGGTVAILSSSTPLLGGFALGAVHSSWVEYSDRISTDAAYGTATQNMERALVKNGRIRTKLILDGLSITPPSRLIKPRVSATQMDTELWATTTLQGLTKVAFGIGDITLKVSQDGAPKLTNVRVWVAIATPKPCHNASRCSAAAIADLPLSVVVSGRGLPNRGAATGTPIAFTYQIGGKNSSANPKLLPAIEQVSVPWLQDGPVINGSLQITAAPVACGALSGYKLATDSYGTTLTVKGLVPESTIGDYCAASAAVRKTILLLGERSGTSAIHHAPTGPIRATN